MNSFIQGLPRKSGLYAEYEGEACSEDIMLKNSDIVFIHYQKENPYKKGESWSWALEETDDPIGFEEEDNNHWFKYLGGSYDRTQN